MAYAQTSVVTPRRVGPSTVYVVVVTETGVTGATDEWSVENLPIVGVLVKASCVLTAGGGTATSVDQQVGDSPGSNNVFENTTPSASNKSINAVSAGVFATTSGVLYGRSKANGTTTGAGNIVTTLWIVEGLAR